MRVTRIRGVALTVSELGRAEAFYTGALGFERVGGGELGPEAAALLGAERVDEVRLERAGRGLALQAFRPAGLPYPAGARACDQAFQHFALPVADIGAAAAGLPGGTVAISRGGVQRLPARSGGASAFKFRDPDGHPLELIEFPDGHLGGIDHSAIVVADAERSVAFYRGLGFRVAARQVNAGPEQDRLDGLEGVSVEVIALEPAEAAPHLELLAYRHPVVRPAGARRAADVAATRLVLEVEGLEGARLVDDPDGHTLLLVSRA